MIGILNIDVKLNSGAGTDESFLSHCPGHGLFIWPFKTLRLKLLSTIMKTRLVQWDRKSIFDLLTGPREHLMCNMKIFWRDKSIEIFICCQKIIIDGVIGVSILVRSEEFIESPDNLLI